MRAFLAVYNTIGVPIYTLSHGLPLPPVTLLGILKAVHTSSSSLIPIQQALSADVSVVYKHYHDSLLFMLLTTHVVVSVADIQWLLDRMNDVLIMKIGEQLAKDSTNPEVGRVLKWLTPSFTALLNGEMDALLHASASWLLPSRATKHLLGVLDDITKQLGGGLSSLYYQHKLLAASSEWNTRLDNAKGETLALSSYLHTLLQPQSETSKDIQPVATSVAVYLPVLQPTQRVQLIVLPIVFAGEGSVIEFVLLCNSDTNITTVQEVVKVAFQQLQMAPIEGELLPVALKSHYDRKRKIAILPPSIGGHEGLWGVLVVDKACYTASVCVAEHSPIEPSTVEMLLSTFYLSVMDIPNTQCAHQIEPDYSLGFIHQGAISCCCLLEGSQRVIERTFSCLDDISSFGGFGTLLDSSRKRK